MKSKVLNFLLIFIFLSSFLSFASTKKCYIIFSSKGDTGTMINQECQKGATIKLNPYTYSKEGYYFSYWEDDFGKIYKEQDFIIINKDIHLYTNWSKIGDANVPVIKIQNQDDKIIEEIIIIKNYEIWTIPSILISGTLLERTFGIILMKI